MIALIALVLVALPAYYTIDSNTKLNGSVSYQRQLSKDSYISQTGSASFYYSDLNFGLGYSHSNDDGEDTESRQAYGYVGYDFSKTYLASIELNRTKEPSDFKSEGAKFSQTLVLSETFDWQQYSSLSFDIGSMFIRSQSSSVLGTQTTDLNTKFKQYYWTIALTQNLNEDLIIGGSLSRYTYSDESIADVTQTSTTTSTSVFGVSGYPTTSYSFYLSIYPNEELDLTFTYSKTLALDSDDVYGYDLSFGYFVTDKFKLTSSYYRSDSSIVQRYYSVGTIFTF